MPMPLPALAPSRTRVSSPFDAPDFCTAASSESRLWFAALYLDPGSIPGDEWLATCSRVATAVELTSAFSALLDLGVCTDAEAQSVLCDLLRRLEALGVTARAGIGPSLTLAQLAGLGAAVRAPLALITPAAVPSFLPSVSVALLLHLHPKSAVTPATVERLQRYGLRKLGHVAHLSERALRRQFGSATGAFLAAVAHGRDTNGLHPTPLPARTHIRLRLASPVSPERAHALLPRLVTKAATYLHEHGQQARDLGLRVRWERGSMSLARRTLRTHTHDPVRLTEEARHLLTTLLDEHAPVSAAAFAAPTYDAIAELRLMLGDFAPLVPMQATFWRVRAQRLAAARAVAETLARRHGRQLLLSPRLAVADAILAEDRYDLAPPTDVEPLYSLPTLPADARSPKPRPKPSSPSADAWATVPLHCHWW